METGSASKNMFLSIVLILFAYTIPITLCTVLTHNFYVLWGFVAMLINMLILLVKYEETNNHLAVLMNAALVFIVGLVFTVVIAILVTVWLGWLVVVMFFISLILCGIF